MTDIDLVGQKIDNLSRKFDKAESKWDQYIEKSDARLHNVEIQTALLEQSNTTICDKIESLDEEVKRINLLSKIIGGIASGLAVIAAAIGISK